MTAPGARRLILCMSVSLDGFVARRDHVIDWFAEPGSSTNDDRRHRAVLELLGQIGLIVLGRGAYEDMVRGWPGSDNPMAVLMNTLPKLVFSSTLPGVEWNNARLSREAVEDEIPELKRQPGNDIIAFGGAPTPSPGIASSTSTASRSIPSRSATGSRCCTACPSPNVSIS